MLFSDPIYLFVFLPVTLLIFSVISNKILSIIFLSIASLFFYSFFSTHFLLLFLSSIAANIIFAFFLIEMTKHRYTIFIISVAANVSFIFYFKYFGYLSSFTTTSFDVASLAIPVGISFYTFQKLGFLYDIYGAKEETIKLLGYGNSMKQRGAALMRFVSYVAFFPQMVIGPIVYLREYVKEIDRKTFGRLQYRDLAVGITLIVLGLAKKMLADELGETANPVFAAVEKGEQLSAGMAWMGALSYYVQLYFDFSGYSDMAIGSARLFGIKLPINFDSPLRASGIIDFYRRWHITLTRLIARMLFTPIALWGTRAGALRGYRGWRMKALSNWLPLVINFQVIAIWHGLAPTFLLFGAIHGFWYICETEARASKRWRNFKAATSEGKLFAFGAMATFLPLLLTFALFRSQSIDGFGRLLTAMFVGLDFTPEFGHAQFVLLSAFAIVWFLPNTNVFLERFKPGLYTWVNSNNALALADLRWRPSLFWGVCMTSLFIFTLYNLNSEAPFIYMGF